MMIGFFAGEGRGGEEDNLNQFKKVIPQISVQLEWR
jgi:hypothetical protein